MMSSHRPEFPEVNKREETVSLPLNAVTAVATVPRHSPIDEYYKHTKELLLCAAVPNVSTDQLLMRLFLLEVVAAAELYFRRILSGIINVCPVIRETACEKMVALGAALYYDRKDLGLALVERVSLSDGDGIRKWTKDITKLEIVPNSSEGAALASFEKVCHLRHAVVHACGELGFNNILELGVVTDKPLQVQVSLIGLQTVISITHSAIRAYNRFLFGCTLRRWIKNQWLIGKWGNDRSKFEPLFTLFYSSEDALAPSDAEAAYNCIDDFSV